MALLQRLSFTRIVLISNKRGSNPQEGGGDKLAVPLLFCHSSSSFLPTADYTAHACHIHPSLVSSVHPAALVGTLDPMLPQLSSPSLSLSLTHMAALLTLILRSQYQGTVGSAALGEVTETSLFSSSVHERGKRGRKSGRTGAKIQ